jgi:hypothetical protein
MLAIQGRPKRKRRKEREREREKGGARECVCWVVEAETWLPKQSSLATHLVKVILGSFGVVNSRLVAVVAEMAGGDQAVTP